MEFLNISIYSVQLETLRRKAAKIWIAYKVKREDTQELVKEEFNKGAKGVGIEKLECAYWSG